MKRLCLLLLALMFMTLAGCAATPDREQIEEEMQAIYNPYDMNYVRYVNEAARRNGARVIWVNPPKESGRSN